MTTIDVILSPEASGEVVMDLDNFEGEAAGGGCRAGFLGLCRALPTFGYEVTGSNGIRRAGKCRDS